MRKKLLSFIKEYIQIHGYAPSMQEMADGVKLKSKSTAHGYLMDLFISGAIETDNPGAPRAIRVSEYQFVKKEYPREINTRGKESRKNR